MLQEFTDCSRPTIDARNPKGTVGRSYGKPAPTPSRPVARNSVKLPEHGYFRDSKIPEPSICRAILQSHYYVHLNH